MNETMAAMSRTDPHERLVQEARNLVWDHGHLLVRSLKYLKELDPDGISTGDMELIELLETSGYGG